MKLVRYDRNGAARLGKPEVTRKDPEFFIKTALGVIGPDDDIGRDERVTKKLDYETELAIVIGKPGRHIPVEDALDHVFGYTIVNDVTARDRQVTLRPDGSSVYNLGPGKNFDTCAPIGPAIVTADEIPDPQNLELRTRVNDELRQNNSTAKMIWTCAQLIAFFSTFITLKPGVVISTGTPGGISDLTAVLGGHAVSRASPPALAAPHLKSGKVRAFAQWGGKRLADFPDVPMFKAWWDKDAEKLADVVKRIGKLEAK